jgi:Pectate lyase superfamily protein
VPNPKAPAGEQVSSVRRRTLFASAVTGVAAGAIVAQASPAAAADAVPLEWFNVKTYGTVGDGSTDDTAAIQAALDAAKAAGGGTVYFPTGTYKVMPTTTGPALSVGGDNIRLVGAGRKTATLVKGANGILLSMSGTYSGGTSGSTHRRYCSIQDLGLNGNRKTGLLLELYYNSCSYFRDVFMSSNNDICIDAVEFWDSRFYNLVIEESTGTADGKAPNVWLRNSSATSGWGYSGDNVNQIHFIGCRWEAFGTGALWITQGTAATNNPNGIYITDCKFETSQMQGGPHLKADASCRHVYATNIYLYAGGFATGYATAQNIIAWAASTSALENVVIANGALPTVNSGVDLYSGPGSTAVLRNVVGLYTTKPTGNHIYEASSTGDFLVENSYGTIGVQAGGTVPRKNQPGSPLRLVTGPVSDSSFTHTPVDGTMAVDTANKRLYVRVGGAWLSTALS